MEIIGIVNQKGGVGKSTTAINLSSCLAQLGKKVLLIDIDPQANTTRGIGFNQKVDTTIYEVLVEELPLSNAIYNTNIKNIDIVPSNIKLANAELELSSVFGRETILETAFQKSDSLDYDYVIIDCNPSLGLLTVNAMVACSDLIIPMEPAIFSLDGIEQLVNVINLIKRKINEELSIKGVLLTRVDARTNIAKEFEDELREIFGDKIFNTIIHQNVKIVESQAEQLPINIYDDKARGAKEYMKLAKELIESE
jgi:chromosome partitioning protein